MKKLLNVILTGMLLAVLSFGTSIAAEAEETTKYDLVFSSSNSSFTISNVALNTNGSTISFNKLKELAPAPSDSYSIATVNTSANGIFNISDSAVNVVSSFEGNKELTVNGGTPGSEPSPFTVTVSCSVSSSQSKNLSTGYTAEILDSAESLMYTGNQIKPQNIIVKDSNGNILPASNYSITYTAGSNIGAGDNAGVITISGVGDYSGSFEAHFNIAKSNSANDLLNVTNKVYDGTEVSLVSIVGSPTGTFTFVLDGAQKSLNELKKKDAGDYTVTYTYSGDDNHLSGLSGSFTASITKCPAVVNIKGAIYSVSYDETKKEVSSGSSTYPFYKTDDITCSINGGSNTLVNELKSSIVCNKASKSFGPDAGTAQPLGLTNSDFTFSPNFDVTLTVVDGSFTINKAMLASVAPPDVTSFEYNGYLNESKRPRIQIKEGDQYLTDSEAQNKGFTYQYCKEDGSDISESSRKYSLAGDNYVVYYKVIHKNYDYVYEYKDREWGKWTFSIKKKELSSSDFTVDSKNFVYDGQEHPSISVKQSSRAKIDVGNNNENKGYDTVELEVSGVQKNAGTYSARVTGVKNDNYTLSKNVSATYTIAQKSVTFNWPASYSGSGTLSSITPNGVIGGDDCQVSFSQTGTGTSGTSKTYTFKASLTGADSSNYKISSVSSKTYTVAGTNNTGTTGSNVNKTTGTTTTKTTGTTTNKTTGTTTTNKTTGTTSSNSTTKSTGSSSSSSGSSSTGLGSSTSSLGSSSSDDLLSSSDGTSGLLGLGDTTAEGSIADSGISEDELAEEALEDDWYEAMEDDDLMVDSYEVGSDLYDASPDMSYARAAHLAAPESQGTVLGLILGIVVCCLIAGGVFLFLHLHKPKSKL